MSDWIVLGVTSVLCFAIKLAGHLVPERWLPGRALPAHQRADPDLAAERARRRRGPGGQDPTSSSTTVSRASRWPSWRCSPEAPFPVVVVSAALTSALVYHLH